MKNINVKFIPVSFMLALILSLAFPAIFLQYYGSKHVFLVQSLLSQSGHSEFFFSTALHHYLKEVMLEWSILSATILLSFAQYSYLRDRSTLFIAAGQIAMFMASFFFPLYYQNTPNDIFYYLKFTLYCLPFFCLIARVAYFYLTLLQDQNKLQMKHDRLQYIATHDSLTRLYNKGKFDELLEETIANAHARNQSFALFIIDIDNFKLVNDEFGHVEGDHIIEEFAEQLSLLIRNQDYIARIGGDEFALVATNLQSPSSSRALINRLMNNISILYPNGSNKIHFSVGISIFPFDTMDKEELLKFADDAMYQAKRLGKNTFRFHKETQQNFTHGQTELSN